MWNPQGRHQRRRENSNDDYYLTINVYDTLPNAKVNIFSAPPGYDTANSHSFFAKGNLFATAYRTRSTDDWNYKYYKYDVRGRVIKMWNIIADFDTLTTEYIYNSQDQITFLYYQAGKSDSKSYYYEYDYTGRLKNTSYYTGPPSDNPIDYTNLASYDYNANSQVSNQNFNGNTLENTYTYNSRNWITQMQNSNNFFNYANTYFKNGNVKTQNISGDYHKPFSNQVDLNYTNTYDKSNRHLSSITPAKKFNLTNTYDKDGNILTLERTGSSGNVMDNFIYSYYSGTNKVSKVKGSTTQYAYDANGNMITDSLNKNTNIKYDYRNLITQIQHKAIVNTDTSFYLTYYSYDEAGNRFAKTVFKYSSSTGPPENSSPGDPTTDDYWELYNVEIYSRDVSGKELAIYKDNVILEYPLYGLDMIGKIKNDELFFYYKDHLGSVRATVNSSGDVVSSQDFDAWGYLLQDRIYDSEDSKFKFTGKERDTESDYDYFGARYYDARIGRWGSSDPLLEKHIDFTPYNYVLDNPLYYIDPDGKQTCALRGIVKEWIFKTTRTASPLVDIPITPLYVFLTTIMGNIGTLDVKESQSIFVLGAEGILEYDQNIEEINVLLSENQQEVTKQTKKLSPSKVRELEKQEGKSVEEIKEDFVGKENVKKFDIYKDPKTKEIIIQRKPKYGKEQVKTGIKFD